MIFRWIVPPKHRIQLNVLGYHSDPKTPMVQVQMFQYIYTLPLSLYVYIYIFTYNYIHIQNLMNNFEDFENQPLQSFHASKKTLCILHHAYYSMKVWRRVNVS